MKYKMAMLRISKYSIYLLKFLLLLFLYFSRPRTSTQWLAYQWWYGQHGLRSHVLELTRP